MDINEIQKQLKICENDSNITLNKKQARLTILKTAIQKISRDNYTDSLKKEYMNKMSDFLEIEEHFQLEDDIQSNNLALKKYLLNSDVCLYLKSQGITSYDLYDLRYYSFDYEMRFGKDQRNVEKAIKLYENSEQILKNEIQKMYIIKDGLGDIFDKDILSQYQEMEKQADGMTTLDQENKTQEQYSNDYNLALKQLEQLYTEGTLDKATYGYAKIMIDQLFKYYQNGLEIIKLDYNQKHL